MRKMTWTLLVAAAITVTATVARADDLTPLIAEIEALQNQVSQLDAQPEASMPSGYDLLSIRDGQGTYEGVLPERNADAVREDSGFTVSVLPMADAAPLAEFSVSGEIRSALVYTDTSLGSSPGTDFNHDGLEASTRGRISVKGKVDTAVGEIGGYVSMQTDRLDDVLD